MVRELTCIKSRGGFEKQQQYFTVIQSMGDAKRVQVYKSTEHHSQASKPTHFSCKVEELNEYFDLDENDIRQINYNIKKLSKQLND